MKVEMKLKIEHDRWGLSVYPWHSVNLVPQGASYSILYEETQLFATAVEVTVLGVVIVVHWPSREQTSWTMLEARGPAWSHRRRRWYSLSNDGLASEHAT